MTRFSAQQKKQSFLQKRIPPEAFKPQGGLLFGSQIHFSQYTEFVFARYGGAEGQPVLTTKLSKDYIYSFREDSTLLG